jgi:hypothetical protein
MTAVDFTATAPRPPTATWVLRAATPRCQNATCCVWSQYAVTTEWCAIQFAIQSGPIIARSLLGVEFCNGLPRIADVSVWCQQVREVPSRRFSRRQCRCRLGCSGLRWFLSRVILFDKSATFTEYALLPRLRFRHRLPQRQVGFRPAISAVRVPDHVGISHGKDSFCRIP